jgi:chromosome segregation ATPase
METRHQIAAPLMRTSKPKDATPADPHLAAVAALSSELDADAEQDRRLRAELEAREHRRQVAREAAEREKREAELELEGRNLEHMLSETAAELAALGGEVREAFNRIATALPRLITAQTRYDTMVKRAATLMGQGVRVPVPKATRLAGLNAKVCELLDYAWRAQASLP